MRPKPTITDIAPAPRAPRTPADPGTVRGESYVLPDWVHGDLADAARSAGVPIKHLRDMVDERVAQALGTALEARRSGINPWGVAVAIAQDRTASAEQAARERGES